MKGFISAVRIKNKSLFAHIAKKRYNQFMKYKFLFLLSAFILSYSAHNYVLAHEDPLLGEHDHDDEADITAEELRALEKLTPEQAKAFIVKNYGREALDDDEDDIEDNVVIDDELINSYEIINDSEIQGNSGEESARDRQRRKRDEARERRRNR